MRVVISVVIDGPAADGIAACWPGEIPYAFRRRLEEALFMAVPTDVSRRQVQRGMSVSVQRLGDRP